MFYVRVSVHKYCNNIISSEKIEKKDISEKIKRSQYTFKIIDVLDTRHRHFTDGDNTNIYSFHWTILYKEYIFIRVATICRAIIAGFSVSRSITSSVSLVIVWLGRSSIYRRCNTLLTVADLLITSRWKDLSSLYAEESHFSCTHTYPFTRVNIQFSVGSITYASLVDVSCLRRCLASVVSRRSCIIELFQTFNWALMWEIIVISV